MACMRRVGARVLIVQDKATVRYIGPVSGQEGTWVGVEWDDPARGKHDGSTGGVRYFETRSGPTAGSFIRIEKVDFGLSVEEALTLRYTNARGELGDVSREEMYVLTARQRRVEINVVGEEKIMALQSMTDKLVSARLVEAHVSHAGCPTVLAKAAASLTDLDLTGNLIADWDFVQQLTSALPGLQGVNLSHNLLSLPDVGAAALGPPIPTLRKLVLNRCGVTWQQAVALERVLPSLTELHLAGNAISHLSPTAHDQGGQQGQGQAGAGVEEGEAGASPQPPHVQGFNNLKVLGLDDNIISSWTVVTALSRLPSLTTLSLSGNPIPAIQWPSSTATTQAHSAEADASGEKAGQAAGAAVEGAATGAGAGAGAEPDAAPQPQASSSSSGGVGFATLEALHLAGCGLSEWRDVDALAALPRLRELRVTGNPVLQQSRRGGRFEVIGRVPGLTMLNGADVKPRERRDAELRYLQNIAEEVEEAEDVDARAAVLASHPRLPALTARYGEVATSGGGGGSGARGRTMASTMVDLKLTCVAVAAGAKMGTQVKKLPLSTTLGALRLLCDKLFKVRVGRQAVFLRSPGDPLPEELGVDEDGRTLQALGVQEGYEVLVDEFDPEERARAAEAASKVAADELAARAADQLKAGDALQAEMTRALGLGGSVEDRDGKGREGPAQL